MGGADKPALVVDGATLLDRVLRATDGCGRTVVVGPERPTARPVLWAREEPPGGGPLAALAAGLELVRDDVVLLLAADLPFLTPAATQQLLDALGGHDGAVLSDGERPQWLCSAWRTQRLRDSLVGLDPAGLPLRAALGGLSAVQVTSPLLPPPWTDCDTPEDLRRAREQAR